MSSRLRSYVRQHHVALLALFVVMSGTAYAAIQLPKNSVKSKHIGPGQVKRGDIAANAVSSQKVVDGSLLGGDFAAGQLPRGPRGATGPQGPTGPTGPATGNAGGDLTGTYPNPTITGGAVGPDELGPSPAVRVWNGNSVATTCATNQVSEEAETAVCWNAESYDPDHMHGSCAECDKTKLFAPRPGLYSVSAGLIWAHEESAGSLQTIIKKNGDTYVAAEQGPAGPIDEAVIQNVHGVVRLNTNEFVQTFAWHSSCTTSCTRGLFGSAEQRSFFAMEWIGP